VLDASDARDHLGHGDVLGACPETSKRGRSHLAVRGG
jgi:hypothetical protein